MLKKSDVILYDTLVEKALASKEALEPFIKEAETSDISLSHILVKHGLFRESDLLTIIAERMKLSCINLNAVTVEKHVLDKIPVKIAQYYKFLPITIKDRTLTIAVPSPLDIKTQDEIRTQLGYDLDMVLACESDISGALQRCYGAAADTLGQIVKDAPHAGAGKYAQEAPSQKVEDIEKLAEDASVIKLVNQIILEAYRKRATDIHFEPYREGVCLRYRIDGVLYDSRVPPEIRNYLSAIISRIKIMSNLNIVERRLPQDGRAVVRVADKVLDLRISTIPTPFGESIVIRILPTQMLFSLEKLGLPRHYMQVFEKLITKPHGIIFVTGPTGSGKTTTLYACLSRINTKERKIITIEDPIEYEISGVTQIQVMSEIGLDFARGLRSILRHDPDVIMVGEVRDLETAEIAIRVALTGHLVFSTLHTNDASSGIARLVDIGVEPYLVSSSVEAFIAQRLIRTICPDCKKEDKDAPSELKNEIASETGLKAGDIKIFRGKGCVMCNNTGFFGRTAIYEILIVDDDIKELIIKKATSGQIKKLAVSKGMRTLRQDGWQRVVSGATTPEEVMNITASDDDVGSSAPKTAAPAARMPPEEETAPPGADRRLFPRLNSRVNIRCKVFKPYSEASKKELESERLSVSKNISAGGLLFISSEPMPVGSVLEISMEIPDGQKPIECLARVIRVGLSGEDKNYDISVNFLDMTSAQRQRLNKYVESGLKE